MSEYYNNNNKNLRGIATFIMAFLIVFLLLFNVREKHDNEMRVRALEVRVLSLDEELLLAQEEILEYLENSDLQETLNTFNKSKGDLKGLVERIDLLTEQLGD